MPGILTLASMYSILRSRAVNFSFSVASLERQDISGKRRQTFRINAIPDTDTRQAPKMKRRNAEDKRRLAGGALLNFVSFYFFVESFVSDRK